MSDEHGLIVDGNNLLMRAVKASEGGGLRLSAEVDGHEVVTGPVLIFINALSRYVRRIDPSHFVVCWDGGASTYRLGIYPEYKSGRVKAPEDDDGEADGTRAFALAKEFLSLCSIHHVQFPGVEADDLVAHFWRHRGPGLYDMPVTILSGDKDFLQLLDGETFQIRPGSKPETWAVDDVERLMGCKPRHLSSVMALTGDDGDGVPGIKGIGTKTAVKLLSKAQWELEVLFAQGHPKILGHEDEVRRNLYLVDLRNHGHPMSKITVACLPEFRPSTGSLLQACLEWCDGYRMQTVRSRLEDGTLWRVLDGAGAGVPV